MSRSFCFVVLLLGISLADKDVYWRDFKGTVPPDAILAGDKTYVGQAVYQGFLIPGSIFPDKGIFVSEYYGKFEVKDHVRILCTRSPSSFKWFNIHLDFLPLKLEDKAVQGGHQGDIRWYIGRTFLENEWRVGKVELLAQNFRGLFVWKNDGSTARLFQFEILTFL